MNNFIEVLIGIVSLIALSSPVLLKLIKLLEAKTLNEHVKTAETFAEQALTLLNGVDGLTSNEVEENAVNKLFERLNASGLKNSFTASQLEQIVHYIYTRMEK